MAAIKKKTSVIYAIFGLIIVVTIVILGFSLLFYDKFKIDKNIRIILGLFITSYGLFRLVNIYYKYKKQSDEEDSDNE
jgi:predicted neutral ceramidase superfamily lipid hydrolase